MGARAGILAAVGQLLGCEASTPVEDVALRVRLAPTCVQPGDDDTILLEARGHFAATNSAAELRDLTGGAGLPFPALTETVEGSASVQGVPHLGLARREGAVAAMLLLPAGGCGLLPAGSPYPASATGASWGLDGSGRWLLVAGGRDDVDPAGALLVDLTTGEIRDVAAEDPTAALQLRRTAATVTPFGDLLLVAGGRDPVEGTVHDTGELLDPVAGRFLDDVVPLAEARSDHGAVVLPSGETLLVGGRDDGGAVRRSLQAVDPISGETRAAGLAALEVGRARPTVLRLTDGRLLVAGGVDDAGAPVATLEWLAGDGSRALTTTTLVPRLGRAFVALPGGGVLAAGGCEDRAPDPAEDCSSCLAGCPPRDGYDAWWIGAEGAAEAVEVPAPAARPALLPAVDGAPWLATDDGFLRFDPWDARFKAAPRTPEGAAARGTPTPLPVDSGAFAFFRDDGQLVVHRFSTRHRLAATVGSLLLGLPADGEFPVSRGLHLAPDRRPGGTVSLVDDGLLLRDGLATVTLTDVVFRNFGATLAFSPEAPPLLLLTSDDGTTELGGASCPWPPGTGSVAVERVGDAVTVTAIDAVEMAPVVCAAAAGEVTLALRGARRRATVVRRFSVQRR